jgi:hypothetical protein
MFGWIPVVLYLFAVLPARRAVLAAFVVGWLFLPWATYKIPQLPAYDKISATCLVVFCAMLIFDMQHIAAFKPKWFDLPVTVVFLCPIVTSLTNGLGLYDGLSAAERDFITWGLPYFIGRVYFSDAQGLRELIIACFLGGLVYVPLCLWESRMYPTLHSQLYGFFPSGAGGPAARAGGWRPLVFMPHGLMLGMWMTAASLCGFWLHQTKSLHSVVKIPVAVLVPVLGVTAVLCRSSGAIVLLFLGLLVLLATRYLRTHAPTILLVSVCVVFVVLRASGLSDGSQILRFSYKLLPEDRYASVATRVRQDTQFAAKARQRPIFGWGLWGRHRWHDEETGRDYSQTDSLWAIEFGTHGTVGLAALLSTILLPVLLFTRRIPSQYLLNSVGSSGVAAALIVCLWMLDNTQNAMFNPIYMLMAGGLAGLKKVVLSDLRSGSYAGVRSNGTQSAPPRKLVRPRGLATTLLKAE